MKKLMIGVGLVLGLFVAGIAAVYFASLGMVEVSDAFFKEVVAGNMEGARASLAAEFRTATSDDELQGYLEHSALPGYVESHWSNRQVELGGMGRLEGYVLTKSGGRVPLAISFVKENGGWKIYSIQRQPAGLVSAVDGQAIPSMPALEKLVVDTTTAFGQGVNARNFAQFYAGTAPELQKEIPLEKFQADFADWFKTGGDITAVTKAAPVFTSEPGMTAGGVLRVEGYFPAGPHTHLKFVYKFVYRFTGWKLIGINVDVAPNNA